MKRTWNKECTVYEVLIKFWKSLHFIQVEKFLSGRVEAGLKSWTECLKGSKTSRHIMDDTDTSMMAHKPGGDPEIQV